MNSGANVGRCGGASCSFILSLHKDRMNSCFPCRRNRDFADLEKDVVLGWVWLALKLLIAGLVIDCLIVPNVSYSKWRS